ncbi:MAG: biotin transporter BioY [Candidatus Liberibacter ctenarytainae]|uniref:Biotin transporter n=1 Tax=Candidatus Liberibacter ctenarytainae TaxID=2020335 RepID=A0A937DJE3_9HYPH|nr:biotin transporter BioY [Candidatus Liberibacter ctenarytainae]
MRNQFASIIKPTFNFRSLQNQTLTVKIVAIILGTCFLTLSSYVVVPMIPIPMTMQTLAVTLVGALYGWRLGGITIVAWLIEGALGLPVFNGGSGGIHRFVSPTAGYLISFPFAGMLMGWLAEKGWNGSRILLAFIGMLISTSICFLFGAIWLSSIIGYQQAIALGVMPFLAGDIVKCALGALTLRILTKNEKK